MNIGLVSEALPYLPSAGGFRLYGANLIRHLAPRHRIDLVSLLANGDQFHLEWAARYCASVKTIPFLRPGLRTRLSSLRSAHFFGKPLHPRAELNHLLREGVARRQWDVLHVEGPYAGGLVEPDLPIVKVLSAHDCWSLRAREMLACARTLQEKWYYRFLAYHSPRYERLLFPRFERCVFVGPRDAIAAAEVAPKARIAVISNGTDTDYYHPVPVEKEPATLVFHGHLGFQPNIEAAVELVEEILPLVRHEVREARVHIVGAEPHPRAVALSSRPGVRVSADLADLRTAVCSGTIYICPVRHGSGLKNKVLEAMAMRLPIVAHPSALVGIDCAPGIHLLAADTPQRFASDIIGLLRDPQRATELANAGRQLVERQYGWDLRAREFERVYKDASEERRIALTRAVNRP